MKFSAIHVAFLLLLYVFLPTFVLSVFLLLRTGSPALAHWTALAALTGVVVYNRGKITPVDVLCFLLLILFSHAVSWWFFDIFHDGLAYFQPAASRVAAGFNPVYDGYMDFGRAPDSWSDQATYFPKSLIYFAACLTAALGDIQFGKAYHLLLLFSALFYTAHVVRGETFLKKCVWFLACLNPIALTQWPSLIIDGALASLTLIGLLFANAFFTRRAASPLEHVMGVMALSLLFCVKTTGFAYGSIIIFFICLHRLCSVYGESKGLYNAFKSSFFLGLRLGGMALLVSAVIGFHPYLTNLREGRNIFYPLARADHAEEMKTVRILDMVGDAVYPSAHNRFTRFFFSIMSHPEGERRPARLKNPFKVSRDDWAPLGGTVSQNAGGLGPLFGLLLCVAVALQALLQGRGNLWLLLTLLLLTFIQPYAWVLRYVPFVWLLPFVCLASIPKKKEVFLTIPLLIAFVNTGGIMYFMLRYQWNFSQITRNSFEPYRGETVFLDQSIFEFDGILNRFDLRQKYVNPEEVVFYRYPLLGHLAQGRSSAGVNIFFPEDLPPLPEFPMFLSDGNASDGNALPWLKMSEGLVPAEDYREGLPVTVWRSYGDRIKFFMRVAEKPASDWRLTLQGRTHAAVRRRAELNVTAFINNHPIGGWKVGRESSEQNFIIPRKLLEDSFAGDGQLLTFMLRMPAVSSGGLSVWGTSSFGLELERLEFHPCGP
jgi:hypothetical protein